MGVTASHAAQSGQVNKLVISEHCLDAASADPTHARLFLTAAASLVGWWAQV